METQWTPPETVCGPGPDHTFRGGPNAPRRFTFKQKRGGGFAAAPFLWNYWSDVAF